MECYIVYKPGKRTKSFQQLFEWYWVKCVVYPRKFKGGICCGSRQPSCCHVWTNLWIFWYLNSPSKRELVFPHGLNHTRILFIARWITYSNDYVCRLRQIRRYDNSPPYVTRFPLLNFLGYIKLSVITVLGWVIFQTEDVYCGWILWQKCRKFYMNIKLWNKCLWAIQFWIRLIQLHNFTDLFCKAQGPHSSEACSNITYKPNWHKFVWLSNSIIIFAIIFYLN